MAKANEYYDVIQRDVLENAAVVIKAHGDPTRDEFETFMQWQPQQFEADRAANLIRLRAWLARDCEPLH